MKQNILYFLVICLYCSLPQFAFSQPSPDSCASCMAQSHYPYSYCSGGTIEYQCIPSSPTWKGLPPLHRQLPGCMIYLDSTGYANISENYTPSWTEESMDSAVWAVQDVSPDSSWDSTEDNWDYFNDTTWGWNTVYYYQLAPNYESVTIYQASLVPSEAEAALNGWLSICGFRDSGNTCCDTVIATNNAKSFKHVTASYAETSEPVSTPGCLDCTRHTFLNLTSNFQSFYPGEILEPYTGGSLHQYYNVDSLGDTSGRAFNQWSIETIIAHEFMHYFGLPDDQEFGGIGASCYPKNGAGNAANDIVNDNFINDDNQQPLTLSHWDSCWFEILYCCNEYTNVKEDNLNALPDNEQLQLSNSPNPFSDETSINFSVGKDANVTLKVYNSIGSLVQTLQNGFLTEGNYSASFAGNGLSKGIYYYILTEGATAAMRGMILVK